MQEQKARQLAQQVFDTFNRADLTALAALLHPQISGEWPFPPPGGPAICTGRDAVLEVFNNARTIIADIKVSLNRFYWVEADQLLFIEASGKATLRKGTPYNNTYLFVIGFRDDLVVLWREYFNQLIVQQALAAEAERAEIAA